MNFLAKSACLSRLGLLEVIVLGFQLMPELLGVQVVILPFELDQFAVSAHFHDLAVFDHDDLVGPFNG